MRSRRSRPARAELRHPSTCPQKPFGSGWTTRWTHTCRRMPKRCGTGWIATLIGISPPQTHMNEINCVIEMIETMFIAHGPIVSV
jgi:hypothetical protein